MCKLVVFDDAMHLGCAVSNNRQGFIRGIVCLKCREKETNEEKIMLEA